MRCLSQDGTLDARGRQKRTLFFVMCLVTTIVSLGMFVQMRRTQPDSFAMLGATVSTAFVSVFALIWLMCKRDLTTQLVLFAAMGGYLSVMLSDVVSRTVGSSAWPQFVLVIDVLLVMEVPAHHSMGVVCVTVVYLVVMSLEEGFRFGILDIPGIMPQEERQKYIVDLLSCDVLPCAQNTIPITLTALMVFVVDFIATRGFARGLLKERESMERTINTVQEIAALLAGYDVEQVAELLKVHGGDLPEGMTEALRNLEENLRMYKAYLPKTCLPFENEKSLSLSSVESASEMGSSAMSCSLRFRRSSLRAQQLGLSSVKGTLLAVNVKDTLSRLVEDSACFSDLFTTLLLQTLQGTETRRGMVDVFIGDRIHCSFNASKQCASHATSALHTATLLIRGGVTSYANMGVATGTVLRGDMGCEVMRRFSMVGELVRDVNGLERVGRMLGCDVVCNRMCFSDAECEHQLRLLPCKVEVASGCEAQVVAELIAKQENTAETGDEWMYMIGGKKDWDEYNTVVRGYLLDEKAALDVAKAWSAAGGVGTPAHAVPSGTCRVVCSYLR